MTGVIEARGISGRIPDTSDTPRVVRLRAGPQTHQSSIGTEKLSEPEKGG